MLTRLIRWQLRIITLYLRDIPATNVVYVRGVTTNKKDDEESSSTKAYQSQILNPILEAIRARRIQDQITCIAFSAGFPTRFSFQPELKKYLDATGKKYNITQHAPLDRPFLA